MRPIKLHLLFLAAMGVSAVLGVASARAADAQAAIRAADAELSALIAKQDAAGIAALYTIDGQLLASGRDFIRGRPAIQEYWQAKAAAPQSGS
jgi:ketosteroid isomerase-like protein